MKTSFQDLKQGDVFVYGYHYLDNDGYGSYVCVTVETYKSKTLFLELFEIQGTSDYKSGVDDSVVVCYPDDDQFKFKTFLFSSDYDEELYDEQDLELLKEDVLGRYPEYFI